MSGQGQTPPSPDAKEDSVLDDLGFTPDPPLSPGTRRWYLAGAAAAALLVVSLALVVAAPGRSMRSVIVSDDQLLELEVPADALPDRMTHEAVRVTRLAPAALPGGHENAAAVYRLEPDGLAFKKPVSFRTTQVVGARLPMVSTVSRDGVLEPVRSLEVTVDAGQGVATIRGRIAHFSWLWIDHSFFSLEIHDWGSSPRLGEALQARATIHKSTDHYNIELSPGVWATRTLKGDAWTLRGALASSSDALTPMRFDDTPPTTAVTTTTFEVRRTFTCAKNAETTLRWEVDLTYDVRETPAGRDSTVTVHYEFSMGTFWCGFSPLVRRALDQSLGIEDGTREERRTRPSGQTPVQANTPPRVGPIVAELRPPVTTYTVEASDPDGDVLTFHWDSTNKCDLWQPVGETLRWRHEHPPCPENEPFHPARITVIVLDGRSAGERRTYDGGSRSGIGPLSSSGSGQ